MTAARSWTVVVLCASCCLALWPLASHAEEVAELLNEAHERYEQSIEEIEREAITRLDELIGRYSDEGNLKKVLELRTQKTKLLEDRAWPETIVFRTMREKIRSSRVRAKRELANAYEEAIAALTKERRYDDAVALREELEELIRIQAAFDFRSEEAERKKPEKDTEDSRPALNEKQLPKNAPERKPRADAGQAGAKTVAKSNPVSARPPEPSRELAVLINEGREREVLADRLATTQAKVDALTELLQRVSQHYLVTDLTYEDSVYLSSLILTENRALIKGIIWYPGTPKLGKGGLQWSASKWSGGIESKIPEVHWRFLILWLMGSKSPEEFVERTQFLKRSGKLEPWIPGLFSEDDFKVWLGAIGCDNQEEISDVIGKLRKAEVEFPAIGKFAAREGL